MSLPASEPPAQLTRISDGTQVLEFPGVLVGEASTALPGKPRWLELRLYRVADGTGRYVVSRTGKSVIYHKADGPCNRGIAALAADLPRHATPCGYCHPPEVAVLTSMPGQRVSAETDHNGAEVTASASGAIEALRMSSDSTGGPRGIGGQFSEPALRLLEQARASDAGIAQALATVRRL